MTRAKLLSNINYALNHIQYGEEREKEVKKAFKKMKDDLKLLDKLKKENEELKKKINAFSLYYILNEGVEKGFKEYLIIIEEENIKLKKVISIIKAKLVPILLLQEVDTLEEYNEGLDDCDEYRLTQEEFDLLKKVFGNE